MGKLAGDLLSRCLLEELPVPVYALVPVTVKEEQLLGLWYKHRWVPIQSLVEPTGTRLVWADENEVGQPQWGGDGHSPGDGMSAIRRETLLGDTKHDLKTVGDLRDVEVRGSVSTSVLAAS